jgi:GntR family transcriptional regulator/MocR family aminotransferase
MGYMILPERLLQIYNDIFENYNSTVPLLNQYVIGKLIETGQYDSHIRRLNNVFRKRLELFLSEFSDVKDKIKITSNGSGQYFLLEFSEKTKQSELIERALEQGVRVYSSMQFWQEKAACPPNTLFLGFSKINTEDIPDCVARLKSAWAEWL